MEAYRVETIVAQDGTLVIKGVPFRPGTKVEVIVLGYVPRKGVEETRYPLRGKPIRYVEPFESVAEDEWEVLK